MSEIIKAVLEVLKLAPKYLVVLGLLAGILLFSGDDFLKRIGLYDFTKDYRQWIGLTFIASLLLFLVDRSVAVYRWIRYRMAVREADEHRLNRLHNLTEDEKQILRYYLAKQTKTSVLRIDDGIVQGLVAHRIIYRSAGMGNLVDGFAHNITDFAWEYLHQNPDLLNGTTDYYITHKRPSLW